MYLDRAIEKTIKKAVKQSKVVLLSGPRQTGKTTVIRNCFPKYNYITLDDENFLALAKRDPQLFFKDQSIISGID